ncbi:cutinase family protein [Micromonospora sp. NPDC005173]|uniref:cutinase family protein n=1 Tax=Micromonospora sp. NPDC005173 TaxID=3157165 RepID=UPI0033B4F7F9
MTALAATPAATTVALSWTNPADADFAGVMIRRASGATPPQSATAGSLVTDTAHTVTSFTDTGLSAGTQYSYALFAHDDVPNYATAATKTVSTTATGPGPVTSAAVDGVTTSGVTLTWTNPADADFAGVMIRRAPGAAPPSSPTGGTLAVQTTGAVNLWSDTGLTPGQSYSYALFAVDGSRYGPADTVTVTIPTSPSLTGTVTNTAASGIGDVRVRVFAADGTGVAKTSTAANGTYSVAGVPAGAYTVCFDPAGSTAGTYGYLPQCWKAIAPGGVPYTVTVPDSGATVTGIDAILATAGSVSGHVTGSGQPLADVLVTVYESNGEVGFATTDTSGAWAVTGLPTGTYTACFDPSDVTGSISYASQCYNGVSTTSSRTPITVTTAAATTGIDAALAPATPRTQSIPTPQGAPPANWSSATQIIRSDQLGSVPCRNVLFLAARGSGESGPGGDKLDPNDKNHGIGPSVMTAYTEFKAGLAVDNTVTVTDAVSVVYPADSIGTLFKGHVAEYISGLWTGVIETRRALNERASQCPTEHFVLSGYSQGAMVMHRVLSNTPGPGLRTLDNEVLGRIDAAILIADGDRVAGDTTQDYGTAKTTAQGIGTQMDVSVSPRKLPSNIGAKTFSICNFGDAVCDFRVPYLCAPCALTLDIVGASVHTRYAGKPEVRNGARAASILVQTGHAPPKPPVITTRDLPAGLVGGSYSTDLTTADHRQGTWTITGGALPAGLNLTGFSITGAPTTVGISVFVLTFADTNGFVVSASASIGIQDGTAQPLTWTPGLPADPLSGPTQAVSCADASLCIAADQIGYLQSFDGTSWTRASAVKPLTIDSGGPWLTSVSCAPRTTPNTAGFCMAVGGNQWAAFDGTTWSSVKTVAPDGLALSTPPLSCTSPTFCMLTLSTNAYRFTGTAWSQVAAVNATGIAPTTLSCTSSIFCMASTTHASVAWVYNGSAWAAVGTTSESQVACTAVNSCFGINSTANTIDRWNGSTWQTSTTGSATALSCATSQFCIAVDTYGNGKRFDGTTWTADNWVGAWFVIRAHSGHVLSCARDQSCYLLDATGGGYQYSNGSWGGHTWVGPYTGNASSISCVKTHCTAADRYGNVWTTDDASLTSAPQVADRKAQGSLWGRTSVSCVSATFCAMTDMLGGAATFNGSYWSDGYQGDTGDSRTDGPVISCVSATFCAGVDDAGHAFFYRGSNSWSAPVTIDSHSSSSNGLGAISCASPTFCVAGSRYPTAYVWNGTSWTATPTPPAGINSISCPKVNFCVAVGYQAAMYFDGTTWSAANTIALEQDVVSVSCATALSCAALTRPSSNFTGTGGSVLAFNGASWTAPTRLATVGDPVQISCGEPSFCAVIDYQGREYFGYTL